MGDSSCQTSDALHSLALMELCFTLSLFGNILAQACRANHFATSATQQNAVPGDQQAGTILCEQWDFHSKWPIGARKRRLKGGSPFILFPLGNHLRNPVRAEEFLPRQACHRQEPVVAECDLTLGIQHRCQEVYALEQVPHSALGGFQSKFGFFLCR